MLTIALLLTGRVATATVAPTLPPAPAEIRTADRCIEDRACRGHPVPWACLTGCIERERDDWEARARRLDLDLLTCATERDGARAELYRQPSALPPPILDAPAGLPGWAWGLIGVGVGAAAGAIVAIAVSR